MHLHVLTRAIAVLSMVEMVLVDIYVGGGEQWQFQQPLSCTKADLETNVENW